MLLQQEQEQQHKKKILATQHLVKNKNVDHKNSLKLEKSVRVEATKKRNEMERHNIADGVLENR